MERAFYHIEVTDLAPPVAVLISDARFVPLESKNHILLEEEPAWRRFLGELRRFLGTATPEAVASLSFPAYALA